MKRVKKENSERGRKSRAKGQRFELKVRADLENLGWIVSKWMNTIDYDKNEKIGKLVPAKRKYNPFFKSLSIGTGFPDFVCFRRTTSGFFPVPATQQEVEFGRKNQPSQEEVESKKRMDENNYEVIGLEVKGNGYLDAVEKGMCIWLLENKIFSKILIARRGEKAGEIEYINFSEKYHNKE